MTERLYYSDAYLRDFEAMVVQSHQQDGHHLVILDRTAFYPASGGQPHDTGTIAGVPVIEVSEDGDTVLHRLADSIATGPVRGRIAWERRFDHMQQHTGQHVLSQAFLREIGAQTVSFHMGESASTIDLDREQVSAEQLARVEDLANSVVMEDRPVTTRSFAQDQASIANLRKPPTIAGDIRVIDVDDFDRCACGGTHVRATGEIGAIHVRRLERRHQCTRVEFLCGWRALRDHRWQNSTIRHLAQSFSVGAGELAQAVDRLQTEAQGCQRMLKELRQTSLDHEARALLALTPTDDNLTIVAKDFEGRDPQEVRILALRLAASESTIALLAATDQTGRLFFARSADLAIDMSQLLQETCAHIGGGGGGRPNLAQGGGVPVEKVREALALATQKLLTLRKGDHR